MFPFTRFHALWRFAGDRTRSSRLSFTAGCDSLPPEDHFMFGTGCAVSEMDIRFSYRGLAPHKFMPMLGVHKTPQPTPKSGAAGLYRCVPGMDVT